MATAEVGIFDAPPEDELPEFARVLLGYDPREVEEHLREVGRRTALLEDELHRARAEAQAALHRLSVAREEVYAEIAARMADVIKATDLHAERIRAEAEEAARTRLSEADREAGQIRTEAKAEGDSLRTEASAEVERARAEAATITGAMEAEQESALRELERLGERLASLSGRLQDIRKGVRLTAGIERQQAASPNGSSAPPPDADPLEPDLLDAGPPEGFPEDAG